MDKPVTFTKNGETREAVTPRQCVRLRFDGWKEVPQAQPEPERETLIQLVSEKPESGD